MHIELRNDDWWDAGKDLFPEHYHGKQELKRALEDIGEQPDKESLDRELRKIKVPGVFSSTPYIFERRLEIQTEGHPGDCYLGKIKR